MVAGIPLNSSRKLNNLNNMKRIKQLTKQEILRLNWESQNRCTNCGADMLPERPDNHTKLCNRCRRHKRRYYKRVVKPKLAKNDKVLLREPKKGKTNEN